MRFRPHDEFQLFDWDNLKQPPPEPVIQPDRSWFAGFVQEVSRDASVCLDGLDGDLARATYAFTWITPDLCHDMHDCDVEEGDTWLAATVPAILASPGWLHGGVLYITFDEDDESSATDNRVLVGPPRTVENRRVG